MKKVLVFISAALMLCSGCSKTENSSEKHKENDHLYISNVYNIYENGFILNLDPKMYIDFETMEKTVFCTKPNCTHKTKDCIEKAVGETPILYGDYIYFFDSNNGDVRETPDGNEFYMDSMLKCVSMTTSEMEEIVYFDDCIPEYGYEGRFIIDNTLYFSGYDPEPVPDEYGNFFYGSAGGTHFLCSIDLDTGKYTNYGSIYDGDKQYEGAANSSTAKILGYYDSRLFIQYSFMKEKDGIEKIESGIDARDVFTVLNFEFDTATKTLKESELPPPSYMDDDTYVYSNYPENSSVVIDKGKTYNIDGVDVDLIGRSFNGKLFMYDCWYDITDGSKHSLGEYENWEILTVYDDCYIMISDNRSKFVKLTEDELLALDD